MENLLSDQKAQEEVEFIKRHIQAITSQKLKYPSEYVPYEEELPRKPYILQNPVVPPPELVTTEGAQTISLKFKSIKPAMTLSLDCPTTSTIASLKELLASSKPGAPAAGAQRWVWKGKALADTKILSEFDGLKDGETVTIMVKPGATTTSSTAAPPAAKPEVDSSVIPQVNMSPASTPVPTLSISSAPTSSSHSVPATVPLLDTPPSIHPYSSAPHTLLNQVQDPEFWQQLHVWLGEKFGDGDEGESNARRVWEQWLEAGKVWLQPSDVARIRDRTELSGLGGY